MPPAGPWLLDRPCPGAHTHRASRPDGRGALGNRLLEESPGSTEQRCRITSGGGDPRDSATEIEPPGP